ncbi:DUF945 family protein [Motilimonas eburnea]|uniref:DUF945 family protein n=1 Tax=Motilimonas eburnea TaxID=1737488 RepID=UPI001E5CC9B9|nr:DUF945 family protein [Motilimonas eburnea]MCE2573619.1 YdgA family protein [Motilimonas eburnea]
MKKTLTAIAVAAIACAGSIYYVGNYTEQQVQQMIAQTNEQNAGVNAQLISYNKGFLSAQSQVQLQIQHPDMPEEVWQLQVDANIQHWPYKAVIDSAVSVIGDVEKEVVKQLFGTDTPYTAKDEVNLLGQLTGQGQLVEMNLDEGGKSLQLTPINISYNMDLNALSGYSELSFDALTIAGEENVSLKDFAVKGDFAIINNSALMTYDYLFSLGEGQVRSSEINVDFTQMSMQTAFKQGQKPQTLDTLVALKVGNYVISAHEVLAFSNSELEINVNGLDEAALIELSQLQQYPDSIDDALVQQLVLDLAGKGANVAISKLNSQTPWGDVSANLEIDLPPGAVDKTVMMAPQSALGLLTGNANARLSGQILQAPGIGDQLNFAVMMGILTQQGEDLVLKGSLKDGQLVVNDNTFPLM